MPIDLGDHVLLVDDDESLRIRGTMLLRKAGYRASSAWNGEEALSILLGAAPPPSLVLLDLVMPIMDGWRFREIQRAHSKLWHLPVVVLADAPMNDDYLEAFDATSVLLKPFDCGQLMRAVTAALAQAPSGAQRAASRFRTETLYRPAP